MSNPAVSTHESILENTRLCPLLSLKQDRKLVYINLGSIVTGNMLDKHPTYCDPLVRLYMLVMNCVMENSDYDILLITSNSGENFEAMFRTYLTRLSENKHRLHFCDWINQVSFLRDHQPAMFVYHGGGNSLREAVTACVPLLVIPFFGDQLCTANVVHFCGIGRSLRLDFSAGDGNSNTIDMEETYLTAEGQRYIGAGLVDVMSRLEGFRANIEKLKQ
ncbi:UDP-glucuronosyltransferase 2A1 [Conoideocrella luteorostrata]|uniref:UDP-glucuronosyltransferase 2A1 n=1 Tax=Conoideocrella luteorostrata TaxID=1105319 RepID=A0AAJ0CQ31_9HYPO|nr:UDP-glucuronosyltransferase 2A1 [Conoideocrella luteorostrata]